MDIYEYLHEKMLMHVQSRQSVSSRNALLNPVTFGKNGIEFRKCRMILAIQNEVQLKHAQSSYPTEDELLMEDQGMLHINIIL